MNLRNIIQRATEFGTFNASKNFFSFALKCIFYIIPAIIIGNYTDINVQKIQKNKLLGNHILYYILLQTFIIIITLYLIIFLWSSYTNEFQLTIAGGFFGVLYFGVQPNYIDMIRAYINS
uniref:Uncharacterized protein n=1 Tax=viral metagenome TaxID=1070528 RepID=A0A6C0LG34_9ZZZZ